MFDNPITEKQWSVGSGRWSVKDLIPGR